MVVVAVVEVGVSEKEHVTVTSVGQVTLKK